MLVAKPTDTSEKGLENLIVRHLTENGYSLGKSADYIKELALDTVQLFAFLQATQAEAVKELGIAHEGTARRQFLQRLQDEITQRGIVDVLRKGISHLSARLDMYKSLPSLGNEPSEKAFKQNIFSVTQQVRYSKANANALDMVIFINGLPLITMELKNSLSRQTVYDAITQYKTTRNANELLFQGGRCMAHFAVDDNEVYFCSELKNQYSWFLPFNQGHNNGAGNPPNPQGLKTDYLWEDILTIESLANIIECFAQRIEEYKEETNKSRKKKVYHCIFPRFHQLRTVRALLRRVSDEGVGQCYLIQHSAGSGKSNTIAWLAYQLVNLRRQDDTMAAQFDSIIVITDRRALDTQITRTIKSYDHVASIIGHSENSEQLAQYLHQAKKIIVTTVQKFPFVLEALEDLSNKQFALLIDEAHSSQGGKTTAKMNEALSNNSEAFEEDRTEEVINEIIDSRRMLKNASYFAFTATPKSRTLELFGERIEVGGEVYFRSPAELTYSTKQAIEEGFILDVIAHYTPINSFYQIAKTVKDDPEFDKKRALKKIRRYVEAHETAITRKAEIMVDHFTEQVIAAHKIGGKARAMIVCNGIARAIDYFYAVSHYLKKIQSPYQAIVAYSGEFEIAGQKKTEADLNQFPSKDIPAKFKQEPYRFLIVANKFITGFDEPLLHSMYVDKPLEGVQAVQTLSRLNRAHPQKHDTFVLDFADNQEAVRAAFQNYYQCTLQEGETDPNKLHDLKSELDNAQVYYRAQIETFVQLYLNGTDRQALDPILDNCVAEYQEQLDENGQVAFKSKAKVFLRSYSFLAALLPWNNPEWEKLSIFMNFLVPKLPAPKEEDLSKGILDTIDMESYRVEKQAVIKLAMQDQDATLRPLEANIGGKDEAEKDKLSNIIKIFNEKWGDTDWKDEDQIHYYRFITEELPEQIAQSSIYQNAKQHSDRSAVKLEHDKLARDIIYSWGLNHIEFYKKFSDDKGFQQDVLELSFNHTYQLAAPFNTLPLSF